MRGIRKRGRAQGTAALAAPPDGRKLVLHVGCGAPNPENLHEHFRGAEWHELRFDIDPQVEPDILGTIVDMTAVETASVDAVWSSHNIEHVYTHEVPQVLGEFLRVLRPGGELLLTTPDLQRAAQRIAAGAIDEPLYHSPSGPVSPLDMLYGHLASVARGHEHMAHRTGFTARSLTVKLREAGFAGVRVERTAEDLALWAAAWRPGAA